MIIRKKILKNIKESIYIYLNGKTTGKILLSLSLTVLQVVSTFLVMYSLAFELSNIVYSAGLYEVVLTMSELLYLVLAVVLTPDKMRALGIENDRNEAERIIASYLMIYTACVVIYLCTAFPVVLMYTLLDGLCAYNIITLSAVTFLAPLLPCALSAIILNCNAKTTSKSFIKKLLKTTAKVAMYVLCIMVFISASYDKLVLFSIKATPAIQTLFFNIGYIVRGIQGDAVQLILLALINITISVISLIFVFKRKKS